MIDQKKGYFWHAAKSVPHPDRKDLAWIKLGLRGGRPAGDATRLDFRFKLEGHKGLQIELEGNTSRTRPRLYTISKEDEGKWIRASDTEDFGFPKGERITEIIITIQRDATLWIDDLLLYEPGKK